MKDSLPLIFLFCLALLVGSCGDNDEATNAALEGTIWVETSYEISSCDDPLDNDSDVSECSIDQCYTIKLSGGTITVSKTEGGVIEEDVGTYTIAGNIILVNIDGQTLPFTYSISGNLLTISFVDPFSNCTNEFIYTASS